MQFLQHHRPGGMGWGVDESWGRSLAEESSWQGREGSWEVLLPES